MAKIVITVAAASFALEIMFMKESFVSGEASMLAVWPADTSLLSEQP